MFGYLEGLEGLEGLIPGRELDERLKKYKFEIKSHRRIGPNE